jgi:hypothetical protein
MEKPEPRNRFVRILSKACPTHFSDVAIQSAKKSEDVDVRLSISNYRFSKTH